MARSRGGSAGASVQLEHILAVAHGGGDAFAAAVTEHGGTAAHVPGGTAWHG
jgi:hypothetical protein